MVVREEGLTNIAYALIFIAVFVAFPFIITMYFEFFIFVCFHKKTNSECMFTCSVSLL